MFSRTSRILFVVALLAVGAYLLLIRPHDREMQRIETNSDRLATFDIASIDSIMIERPMDTLVFSRTDSLWRMTAPVSDSAEPGAIGKLLDALRTAEINRSLGPQENLTPYGLDRPDAVITLAGAHRVLLKVAVGKNTVDNAWCYARSASGDILLIPTDVHSSSIEMIDTYRNHRVLDFEVSNVTSYEIRGAESVMAWTRRGENWYALVGRDSVEGDSIAVTSPLHRLRGLRAVLFVDSVDSTFIPADGYRYMTLWMGPKQVHLRFNRAGTPWAVTDGTRFMLVDDDISDLFSHTVTELRDRRLLQFNPAVTHRINYAAPTATGELVRAGGQWAFPNAMMGRVNPEYAADFVRALRGLKWSEPGDEAARTTGRVSYRIEIMGEGDRIIDQLTAGPYDASTSWVTSRSSHGTWLVENARLDEVSQRFARLKQR